MSRWRPGPKPGSTRDRKNRRQWLLDTFGDGETAECQLKIAKNCLGIVDIVTLSVDRFPIPAREGGSYKRDNIRPVCHPCNSMDGGLWYEDNIDKLKNKLKKHFNK